MFWDDCMICYIILNFSTYHLLSSEMSHHIEMALKYDTHYATLTCAKVTFHPRQKLTTKVVKNWPWLQPLKFFGFAHAQPRLFTWSALSLGNHFIRVPLTPSWHFFWTVCGPVGHAKWTDGHLLWPTSVLRAILGSIWGPNPLVKPQSNCLFGDQHSPLPPDEAIGVDCWSL